MSAASIESESDFLFLFFTDVDITGDHSFDAWRQSLGDAAGELQWRDRLQVDPDQRPGESPHWRFLAIAGAKGPLPSVFQRLAMLEDARRSAGADFVVWAYESIGDFVRKSDGLAGSPSKTVLAPGAYRITPKTASKR
jgi:hypothetical protein